MMPEDEYEVGPPEGPYAATIKRAQRQSAAQFALLIAMAQELRTLFIELRDHGGLTYTQAHEAAENIDVRLSDFLESSKVPTQEEPPCTKKT